jgi:predicted Zn finger-like uncharacterized protein
MLIVCPSCATSYQVEPQSLGQGGRSVRCARCQNVWFATIPSLISAGSDEWDVIDTGPRVPSVDGTRPIAASEAVPADFTVQPASMEGIDLAGLSAEIDTERAERESEADAVLAEVAQEIAAVDPPLAPAEAPRAGEDIETVAARRARREALNRRNWLKLGVPAAVLILTALNASLVSWRAEIVRLLPQTASLYAAIGLPVNLRGLEFDNIRLSRAKHEGVGVLVVEGNIVNVTSRTVEVPRLRLAVRNEAKREVYAWTALPSRSILGPGEALPFRSRLASPPADAREVQVRFFNRGDMIAGLN